jgi:hypothetical protein
VTPNKDKPSIQSTEGRLVVSDHLRHEKNDEACLTKNYNTGTENVVNDFTTRA